MNLDNLFSWLVSAVLAYSLAGKLDGLKSWVIREQAVLIRESRASNWGSPRFFPNGKDRTSDSKIRGN